MISSKEAELYLSKNGKFGVSKDEVDSFKFIFKMKPEVINKLKPKIIYININFFAGLMNKIDNGEDLPNIKFKTFTLKEAIKENNLVPTIYYFNENEYGDYMKGDIISINQEEFFKFFATFEYITEEVTDFVKEIRRDFEYNNSYGSRKLNFEFKTNEDYFPFPKNEDEEANIQAQIYFYKELEQIVNEVPFEIKKYFSKLVYLSSKEFKKIYKGKPSTLTLSSKEKKLNFNDKDFLKKRNEIPSIIFVTKEQLKKIDKSKGKTIKINLTEKQISSTLKKTIKVTKKIDALFEELKNIKNVYNELLDKQYDEFISNLMTYSSKTPMLENQKQNTRKVIKSLLQKTKRIKNYHQTLVYTDEETVLNFLKKCVEGKTKGDFTLTIYDIPIKELGEFPFIVFLTKKQKQDLLKYEDEDIIMSNSQFHKTCFATILLNRDIYYLNKYGEFPPPIRIKRIDTPLAIEMRNLIDFDEPVITPTTPTAPTAPKPKNILDEKIEKNLLDFTKRPYKNSRENLDLSYFKKLDTEILNGLIREFNYPITKYIIGIKLTKEIKEQISKITNEAAIGLTWIIRAIVLSNKINSNFSKKELKDFVKYYIYSLSKVATNKI